MRCCSQLSAPTSGSRRSCAHGSFLAGQIVVWVPAKAVAVREHRLSEVKDDRWQKNGRECKWRENAGVNGDVEVVY
jgi:hypothetical protein